MTEDDIKIIRNNEYCTSEIKIALVLCYCRGKNPKKHVHNNEYLTHETTGALDRKKENFQKPCASTITLEPNMQVNGCTSKKNAIWICAYYNKITHNHNCDEIAKTASI